ncbi:hypothetical protein [Pseudomonas moraviensis]|uniref:hypothetical protein n=1 Tax=Pseudomonas moraviensis TaxID=321662 RepID=UPI001160EBB6|nr:hypothetical protein [Pseudomonas moraviensis]
MTIDATTRILLEKYDPTNKALQAPVSASSVESLHSHKQANKVSPVGSQKVVYKSASGRTGKLQVLMSADKYSESEITTACTAFNKTYPRLMSSSFQLPANFEGIPVGSWVYLSFEEN